MVKVVLLLIALIFLQGCKVTVRDYKIEYDAGLSSMSDSCVSDRSYGAIYFESLNYEEMEGNILVQKGPYLVSISVELRSLEKFGDPKLLLINDAELILHYENKVETVLNSAQFEWIENQQQEVLRGNKRGLRKWKLHNINELHIDFKSLKKVEFNVVYEGIYEDGVVRKYWQKNIAVPKFEERTFNPSIAALMGV